MTTTETSTAYELTCLKAKLQLTTERRTWARESVHFENGKLAEAVAAFERGDTDQSTVDLRARFVWLAYKNFSEATVAWEKASAAVEAAEAAGEVS